MNGKFLLFLMRISMGWIMFYAGITKVLNPDWTAAGFLKSAKTFPEFYLSLTEPGILPIINLVNQWGLTLLGVSLILGLGVRLSSVLGAVLMMMYYFPGLDYPKIGTTSYVIDEHVIYALLLLYFAVVKAGRYMGLDNWLANKLNSGLMSIMG